MLSKVNSSSYLRVVLIGGFVFVVFMNVLKIALPPQIVNGVFFAVVLGSMAIFLIPGGRFLKLNRTQLVAASNLGLILLFSTYSLIYARVDAQACITFALQYSVFWISLFVVSGVMLKYLSEEDVLRVLRVACSISSAVVFLSLIERAVPTAWMETIINRLYLSKGVGTEAAGLPISYYMMEFGGRVLRVGSIFFEPVTFGLFAALMTVAAFELARVQGLAPKWKKIRLLFVGCTLLAWVKSGVIIVLLDLLGRDRRVRLLALVGLLLTIVLLPMGFLSSSIDWSDAVYHFAGLVQGLQNAGENPFLGHGLGTAGFQAFNLLSDKGTVGQYFDVANPYRNGNESMIGVIAYQFGYPYLVLFVILNVSLALSLRHRSRAASVLVLSVFLISFFTESVMSTIFQFTYAFVLSLLASAQMCATRQKPRAI